MVAIYEFELYEAAHHRWSKSAEMGTLEAIGKRHGIAMRQSVLMVDDGRVGTDGMLLGRPKSPNVYGD
jgi:hypothetical protein